MAWAYVQLMRRQEREDEERRTFVEKNPDKVWNTPSLFPPQPKQLGIFDFLRQKKYDVFQEIGRGGYGVVYKARRPDEPDKIYALKINFDTVHRSTVYLQAAFFYLIRKKRILPKMVDFFFFKNTPIMVIEYFQHQPYLELFESMKTLTQIKHYMIEMLKGIFILKGIGIYHRDVKPMNFLYNRNNETGMIIDFGLAQVDKNYVKEILVERIQFLKNRLPKEEWEKDQVLYQKQQQYKIYKKLMKANENHGVNKIGTQSYVSLQTLLHGPGQGHECEMWSAGVTFLQFMTQKFHFFAKPPLGTHLCDSRIEVKYISVFVMQLAHIFGAEAVQKRLIDCGYSVQFPKNMPEHGDLKRMIALKSQNQEQNQMAFDLLMKMIEIDPQKRITVQDAIWHPFFDEVRKQHFRLNTQRYWYNKELERRTNQPKDLSMSKAQSAFAQSSYTKTKKTQREIEIEGITCSWRSLNLSMNEIQQQKAESLQLIENISSKKPSKVNRLQKQDRIVIENNIFDSVDSRGQIKKKKKEESLKDPKDKKLAKKQKQIRKEREKEEQIFQNKRKEEQKEKQQALTIMDSRLKQFLKRQEEKIIRSEGLKKKTALIGENKTKLKDNEDYNSKDSF